MQESFAKSLRAALEQALFVDLDPHTADHGGKNQKSGSADPSGKGHVGDRPVL